MNRLRAWPGGSCQATPIVENQSPDRVVIAARLRKPNKGGHVRRGNDEPFVPPLAYNLVNRLVRLWSFGFAK